MSDTPGWTEKEPMDYAPGVPVTFLISQDTGGYYLDNMSEFKKFPPTPQGWADL